jgi:photosystem II stability/assembly factor-like uncharacterized protein
MRILIPTLSAVLAVLCGVALGGPRWSDSSRGLRISAQDVNGAREIHWSVQTSGIDTNLRGVSAADAAGVASVFAGPDAHRPHPIVVWVCGSNGVILFSTDEGKSWKRLHVAGGETLDFRGIVAVDAKTALVMSSGEGDKSRIYKTTDGGETWKLEFTDKRPSFFLDALVCASECYALSDPVDGKFVLVGTHNREHWEEISSDGMPSALPGEGAFAASGTSLAIDRRGEMYFGTGGGKAARVFHSADGGKTWAATETPIASGNASSGIFSIACARNVVIAVGGDYKDPNKSDRVSGYSLDHGETWHLAAQQPTGYRSSVVSFDGELLLTVGPSGQDLSQDTGLHWTRTDSLDLNAAFVLNSDVAWAVGAKGTIARFIGRTIVRGPTDDRARLTVSLLR